MKNYFSIRRLDWRSDTIIFLEKERKVIVLPSSILLSLLFLLFHLISPSHSMTLSASSTLSLYVQEGRYHLTVGMRSIDLSLSRGHRHGPVREGGRFRRERKRETHSSPHYVIHAFFLSLTLCCFCFDRQQQQEQQLFVGRGRDT